MAEPKVSILCITYNHAGFIRQTLDSFLMQKTNFSFEVLINDDASTDGTTEILREYQEKYPDIIHPIFHEENLYSQGVRGMYTRFLLPKAKGEYIALCDGDDFWTDQSKLQRQVDFLEAHEDYALCFHPVRVYFENGEQADSIYPAEKNPKSFTTERLLQSNFIQTNSVMYRKQVYKNLATDVMPGDWYMHLYHAQFGKIGFINRVMSVYRRHPGGVWWNEYKDIDKLWNEHGKPHLQLYKVILKMYPSYGQYVIGNISTALEGIIAASDGKHASEVVTMVGKMFSDHLDEILSAEVNKSITYHKELEKQATALHAQSQEIDDLRNARESLAEELATIKSSRAWKVLRAARAVSVRLKHPIKTSSSLKDR